LEAEGVGMGGTMGVPTGNNLVCNMYTGGAGSEACIKGKSLVSTVDSHSGHWIFSNAFFEEVCFPLDADHFYPFKPVASFVVSATAKGCQELVSAELDVVAYHGWIHSNEFNGEGIGYEFHFGFDCFTDDINDACFGKTVDQFGVEEARKVTVESFAANDEFIAEVEAMHESLFLEPEYDTERAQEEDAFDSSKCNYLSGKTGIGGVAPFESPVDFSLNAQQCFDGMEQV
jgi:hypothetical protein